MLLEEEKRHIIRVQMQGSSPYYIVLLNRVNINTMLPLCYSSVNQRLVYILVNHGSVNSKQTPYPVYSNRSNVNKSSVNAMTKCGPSGIQNILRMQKLLNTVKLCEYIRVKENKKQSTQFRKISYNNLITVLPHRYEIN